MAVSKELRNYLDKDGKGQYKKTRKNVSKVLAYYGYRIEDIQKVFNTDKDYYSRYFEDMVRRDKVTARVYFTEEEQDILEGYEDVIDKVYQESTGTVKKVKTEPKKVVKAKKPVTVRQASKGLTPSKDSGLRSEDETTGINERDIKSSSLLNKLHKISESDTESDTESDVRKSIKVNRQQEQRPVVNDTPSEGKCKRCGGRGWVMGKDSSGVVRKIVCPDCLGNPVRVEREEFTRYGKPLLEELIENKYYLNTTYKTRTLMEENMDAYHVATRQFDNYLEYISGLLTEIKNGELPVKSYYVATPDGYGKKHFVYQCMKELVSYGYKPTQLLNGGLLLDLYNKREFKELNELLDGDMIFVTISALSKTKGLGNIIKYVADVAERRGVPAVIIGRVSVEVFLRDKDYNLPSLLGRRTSNGDFGHFQCEGFFGKDFNVLSRLQQERMSGSLISR